MPNIMEDFKQDHIAALYEAISDNSVCLKIRNKLAFVISWMQETQALQFHEVADKLPENEEAVLVQLEDGSFNVLTYYNYNGWKNSTHSPIKRWASLS